MNTNVCVRKVYRWGNMHRCRQRYVVYIYRPTKGDDYTVLDRSTSRLPAKKYIIYYGLQG